MELVDLYDENRVPLGRTAERYGKKGPGEYRVVVHVCVFDHQGRLLIQQRTPEKILWPDRWDVSIGGGVDAGETSRQAAEREFREELGYPLDLAGSRPFVTVNFPAGFDDFYIAVRDLDLGELTLQKEEVRAVRWATRRPSGFPESNLPAQRQNSARTSVWASARCAAGDGGASCVPGGGKWYWDPMYQGERCQAPAASEQAARRMTDTS